MGKKYHKQRHIRIPKVLYHIMGSLRQFSFAGPLLFILILALPWLFFFFPGTLQWDAHAQLWVFFGDPAAVASAGNHPVILTQIMG